MFFLINSKPSALLFNKTFFNEAFHENKKTHISIQQYSLTICVQYLEHDLKYSVFKVAVYVKYEFNFLLAFKFLTGQWSVGLWSVVLRKPYQRVQLYLTFSVMLFEHV